MEGYKGGEDEAAVFAGESDGENGVVAAEAGVVEAVEAVEVASAAMA